MKMPRFPSNARSVASIVIPVHGQEEWTRRALAAVHEHTSVTYEVIVVDDASPTGTAEWLGDVNGILVHRNERNVGFGVTCNVGAAHARGRHLVFLNSDALPQAGWLEPLVHALDNPDVGAAGPRILNLDGTLQEAGALVAGDGTTEFYGLAGDPDLPEHTFARTVDYVSGACLAVKRAAFSVAGGFDAAYGRGYYEDVDLCLRLRKLGYRTLYVPQSTVMHAHRASSSEEEAVALSEVNRSTFIVRRRADLAGRPAWEASLRGIHAAREGSVAGTALIVAEEFAAVEELVESLAAETAIRTTVFAPDVAPATDVEVLPLERLDHELNARRFAYDIVFVGDDAARGVVQRTQPQAVVHSLPVADAPAALLADAGVVSR
jgi:GT2 family glycosyltransferase